MHNNSLFNDVGVGRCTYFGNGVLISENILKEFGGGLRSTVRNGTVAVHHQILFDASGEVLLPARLTERERRVTGTISMHDFMCICINVHTHPAAVMHTAKHWRGIALFGLGKAHRTLAHRTRVRLRVFDLKAGGQHQGVRVVSVALDQRVNVPFAVHEQMLGPVQIQTQSTCHLLYGALHQLLHLLLSHGATHGEQHGFQDAILHVLRGN